MFCKEVQPVLSYRLISYNNNKSNNKTWYLNLIYNFHRIRHAHRNSIMHKIGSVSSLRLTGSRLAKQKQLLA